MNHIIDYREEVQAEIGTGLSVRLYWEQVGGEYKIAQHWLPARPEVLPGIGDALLSQAIHELQIKTGFFVSLMRSM